MQIENKTQRQFSGIHPGQAFPIQQVFLNLSEMQAHNGEADSHSLVFINNKIKRMMM
jgi:hypothetical protein